MKHQEFSQGKWPYASEIPFSSESQDLGNSELFVCFHVTLERKSFWYSKKQYSSTAGLTCNFFQRTL